MKFRPLLLAAVLAGACCAAAAVDSDPAEAIAADVDVAAARAAHDRKDWAAAVAHLLRAERRFPRDADLQNSLGYAYRNLKQYEPAFAHYRKALTLDPRHRGAHEYIGEAYLQVGDLASAEKHVQALRGICLLPCSELQDLQKSVEAYKARRN